MHILIDMVNTFSFSKGHTRALTAYKLTREVLHSTHPDHINGHSHNKTKEDSDMHSYAEAL